MAAIACECRNLPLVLSLTTRPVNDPLQTPWRSELQDTPVLVLDLAPLAEAEAHELARELDADADYQGRANRIALIRVTQVVHRKPSVPNERESDHDAVVTADMTRNLHTMEHSTEPLTDQSAGQPPSGEKDRPLPTVSGLVEP